MVRELENNYLQSELEFLIVFLIYIHVHVIYNNYKQYMYVFHHRVVLNESIVK